MITDKSAQARPGMNILLQQTQNFESKHWGIWTITDLNDDPAHPMANSVLQVEMVELHGDTIVLAEPSGLFLCPWYIS